MKLNNVKILITTILVLFSTFYQTINGDCECDSGVCNSDCLSIATNGKSCINHFDCQVFKFCEILS